MSNSIILPITLTIAGAAALINVWIAIRVGKIRIANKVSIGDGGHEPLAARMRAHSNFTEYVPLFLILMGLIELASGLPAPIWLWGVGIVFILARIAHVFGMDRPAPNPLRMGGIIVTMLCLLGLAIYALALPYLAVSRTPSITYAAVQAR
jgi:uncharacterized membrane protein YecN with MAPEG domain